MPETVGSFLQVCQDLWNALGDFVVGGQDPGGFDSVKEMLKENIEKSQQAVKEKTEQLGTFMAVIVLPVVLLVGLFVLKIAYDIFTGTADKVGDGVKVALNKSRSFASSILKPAEDVEEEGEEKKE